MWRIMRSRCYSPFTVTCYNITEASNRAGGITKWAEPFIFSKSCGLAFFGLGRIGSDFAGKMRIFVKEILGYDPNLSAAQLQAKGAIPSSFEDIFSECEIISLHLPYSANTHHFISDREIALMKQKPIVINVSRGGLIDTQALIRGLRSGQLSGAGLDVLENEPEIPQELLQLENVIVTPHAAWYSVEASNRLRRTAMTDIIRVLSGQKPHYPVPGRAWDVGRGRIVVGRSLPSASGSVTVSLQGER